MTGISNIKKGRMRNLHSATVRKTNSPKKKRSSNELELLNRVRVNRNAYRPYSANHQGMGWQGGMTNILQSHHMATNSLRVD